jgi:hypothetical protein
MNLIFSDTIIAGFGVPVDTVATFQGSILQNYIRPKKFSIQFH